MSEPTTVINTSLKNAQLNETADKINSELTQHGLFIGILLLLLGSLGLFLPTILSVTTNAFIGATLFVGGILWAVYSIKNDPVKLRSWFKPAILIISAVMMLTFPAQSIDALAMILAVYLLADASGSFVLAYLSRHHTNWLWMGVNGLTSLIISVLIILNWPKISAWILGVYIGISLIFDGVSLIINHFDKRKLTS